VAGAIAVASAGCASKQAEHGSPQRVAGPAVSADDRYWRVEIEEEGLPAQLAPKDRRPVPDEPSEPWSPNYGTAPPKATAGGPQSTPADPARAAAARAPLPQDLQPASAAPSRQSRHQADPAVRSEPPIARIAAAPAMQPGVHRASAFDEEALIRRAIAEHEMRRRD
jgi:hypothetical protein